MNILKARYSKLGYTFSTEDKYLYYEISDDIFNTITDEEERQTVFKIDGKLVRCATVLRPLSGYENGLKNNNDDQAMLKSIYTEFAYNKHAKKHKSDRRDKGYINYLKDLEDTDPEDYYGLLKEYLTADTMDYIDSKVVFGYLGHEGRTIETDKVIRDFLRDNPDLIKKVNDEFLTSRDGRHFMDSCTGPDDLRKYLIGVFK